MIRSMYSQLWERVLDASLMTLTLIFITFLFMLLGIFAGSVQALIFSTLAAAYIAEALE